MKIAVTGGAGFIGSHLVRAYLDAGHDVMIIDNLPHQPGYDIDIRARFYNIDMHDRQLNAILQQERPDLVSYHTGQLYDLIAEQPSQAGDLQGLLNVLEGSVSAGVSKIVFASAGNNLYGALDEDQLPVTEDAPLCSHHPHDVTKIASEWYVRNYTQQHGLKHTILRYADVYGETESQYVHHPLTHFILMFAQQQAPIIDGTGEEIRDAIFIDDVVRANLCVLEHGDNETFNISSGRGSTLNQLYRVVATLLKSKLQPIHISGRQDRDSSIVLDNSHARTTLEWVPQMTLYEGIQEAMRRLHIEVEATVSEKAGSST
ncbi:MAG: NAD-dependent epimerase/dehydratase family protein [Ktedonobacteraceae bacterium]|nr:NAD-dependent epimerase/dehydratase family protein [Ktedonobacteraceae bacterium]